MKIKKTLIITLFLLCILMIGAVNASSDTNDTVGNDVSYDTVSSSDVSADAITTTDNTNEEKTSTIDTSKEIKKTNKQNDKITTTNNTGEEKTSTIDTSKEIKKTNNKNDEPLNEETYDPRSFSALNKEINDAEAHSVKRLDHDYVYDNHSDESLMFGISITKPITIIGKHITIDGQGQARIFNILPGIEVTLINITFINGYVTDHGDDPLSGGGAIYNQGHLTLINTTFNNNTAKRLDELHLGKGGAIYANYSSTINIINSTFNNNTVKGNQSAGGAIYATTTSLITITNSTFNNNTAEYDGGAIYTNTKTPLTITNSTFNNNTAYNGGAVCTALDSKVTITNSNFTQNTAKGEPLSAGGAIYTSQNSISTITNSNFTQNTAKDGGAILNYGKLTIKNTQFKNNTAMNYGGAINTDNYATLTITNSNFTQNTAKNDAGAIYNAISTLIVKNSIFHNNTATRNGGAIRTWNNTEIDIDYCNFTKNKDGNDPYAAIYIDKGTPYTKNIHNSNFFDNDVICEKGSVDLSDNNCFYIRKITKFTIENITNTTTDKAILLNITESKGFSGTITIKIGNNDYNITFINGTCIDETIKVLIPGKYKALIDFPGNKEYMEAKAESNEFEVKYNTQFTIIIGNSTIDKPIIMNITEKYGFNGNVTVKIGDYEYNITLTNGSVINDTIILPLGKYNATINFEGNENYTATNATSNEFLIKYPTTFIINNILDTTTDKPIFINITEKYGFNGTIPIKIGNIDYNITFINGTFVNDTIILPQGKYQLVINFLGNDVYKEANATSNIFIIRYPTQFTIQYIANSTTEKAITITATEKNGFTGTIPIKIGNTEYNIVFTKGTGVTNAILLPHGKYTAIINFPGNDAYTAANAISNLFTIKYPTAVYNDITLGISSEIITPVLDKVNEVTCVCYVKDDKNKKYLDGTITVTLYTAVFNSLTLKTTYIPTTYTWDISESEKISGFWILSNDKIVLRKTISSASEKKGLNIVSSTSNSKLYNKLFKGEDGGNTVLYMITNTKFKINKIPVTNTGNGTEIDLKNPMNSVTKIKIAYSKIDEPKTISLTKSVKFIHDIIKSTSKSKTSSKKVKLTLKKVKVKKSSKKLVLKATLKKGKKALKYKKVTFKFNGKKYVRKTNKKGVAKLTIKKSVLKKLKVGKKIKYQVSYKGKTKKRTAKVKK